LSTTGFSTEVQSPTYVAVSVWALSFILDQVRDPQVRAPVALLRDRFLLEGALAVHPEANQMAGPYSRSFADGILGGATLTSLLFGWESQRAGWASADRIGPVWEAVHGLDLNPAALIAALPRAGSPAVIEIFRGRSLPLQVRAHYLDAGLTTTYLGATGALGTAVQRLHPQTEGVVIQIQDQANPGGLASGVVRTGADEMDSFLAAPGDSSWVRVAAVQEGPRALVAMRRSFPPGESQLKRAQLGWVMEERLGQWSDLQLDGVELNLAVGESVSLTPGSWLTLRRGKSWLGLNLVSRPEVGVALQVGRVERREGELLVAAHGRDGESLVPAQGVVAEALWAVIIGEEGEHGRRNLIDDLRRREQVQGSHEGSQIVGQWTEPMESLPSPRMRSVLSVRWDRTSLIRMADERLGRNWLQPEALVTAPEMTMPASSARGFGVHGDFAFDGLPSGGWVVGRPGADRVQVSNPTSATVRLRHSYGPEELLVPPWGQVTVIKLTPSQARFWDEYDRSREGE
jgi:hypothetical protein